MVIATFRKEAMSVSNWAAGSCFIGGTLHRGPQIRHYDLWWSFEQRPTVNGGDTQEFIQLLGN